MNIIKILTDVGLLVVAVAAIVGGVAIIVHVISKSDAPMTKIMLKEKPSQAYSDQRHLHF